jgi:hypothetical protein
MSADATRSSRVIAPSRSVLDSLITMILGKTVFLSVVAGPLGTTGRSAAMAI